jgi:predicted dehydrogenase
MARALRVGLVGCGGISGGHLTAFAEFPDKLELVAVCDIDRAAAQRRAQQAGVEAVYTDFRRLLAHPGVDAVDLCTTHDTHAALAVAASEAGRHVLVEKPMACSLAQCQDMLRAAALSGVTLMVAQCERYQPRYRGVRRLIREGELGMIHAVRFDSMQNLPAFLPPGHWLYDGQRAGGGVVISVAVHRIDLLRMLVGDVRRVSAVCRTRRAEFVNGAEDYAAALLEFGNGAVGEMFATYSGYRMPWSQQFMIFGQHGAVHAVPPLGTDAGPALVASSCRGGAGQGWAGQFTGFVPVEPDRTELPTDDGFVNELVHFAECCQTGAEPLSSGRDNVETMKVVFGIYESARSGQPVELAGLRAT